MIEGIASRIGVELDAETKEKVANEQLRMVWAHAAVGTLIATAFAVVMALHLRGNVELGLVQLWIAMKLLVACRASFRARFSGAAGFPAVAAESSHVLAARSRWCGLGIADSADGVRHQHRIAGHRELCCVACVARSACRSEWLRPGLRLPIVVRW